MQLEDLTEAQLEKLSEKSCDWIVEKHEGPLPWKGRKLGWMEPQFMEIDGYDVLLPIERDQLANVEILRCFPSKGERALTIFLKNTTFYTDRDAGYLAVCERVPGEEWYTARVYHEWWMLDYEWLS